MIATRIFRLLLVALSILAAAEAVNPRQGVAVGIRGALNVRQDDSSSGASKGTQQTTTSNPTPTGNTNTKTTATPTASEDNTSPTQTNTKTTPTSTETKTTPTSNPNTKTTPTTTQTQPTPTSTTDNNNDNNATPSATSSPETTPTTYTTVVVMTTTNSNGDAQVVTTSSTATGVATLTPGSDSSDNQGMTAQTRNTIIGVVVGVGGAIILAVIGLIWWRVWGRKKNHEENDGLMGYGGYTAGAAEKPESLTGGHTGTMGSGSSRTPFQSTLESYHAPTQVNQASNF